MFYFECGKFAILERFLDCEKKRRKKDFTLKISGQKIKDIRTNICSDVLFLITYTGLVDFESTLLELCELVFSLLFN